MTTTGLGERVKAARLARKMTLADLAGACGLTKGFISQMENGYSNPSLNTLRKIASILEIPMSGLLVAADPKPFTPTGQPAEMHPVVLHEANYALDHSDIMPLFSRPDGVHALVTLVQGTGLVHAMSEMSAEQREEALITVLSGSVRLVQNEDSVELSRGGIATWNARCDYKIELIGLASASLLIYMPQHGVLPRLETVEAVEPAEKVFHAVSEVRGFVGANLETRPGVFLGTRERATNLDFSTITEGPLRLVAMRAQRLAQRRRES